MGNYLPYRGTADGGVEDLDPNLTQTYHYPPKSGSYFANYFTMGGERFDNMNPEAFLFGENHDLNYLTNKPSNFPFPAPAEEDPSNAIRSLVHLRKESLKIIKEENSGDKESYSVEFIFDADVECAVRIFMIATEDISNGSAKYHARAPELASEPVMFTKGPKQTFSSHKFLIQPKKFEPSELNYIPGQSAIPLVVQITVEHQDFVGQSESTFAGIEKLTDGCNVKFLKQKLMIDGFCFIAQEIFGIENQENGDDSSADDLAPSQSDNTECVICFASLRDTLILPCRHLYLCKDCAEHIRSTHAGCPVCKQNFHALLQITAVRKKQCVNGETHECDGYEDFSLIEAMTGNGDSKVAHDDIPRRNSSTRSRRSARPRSSGKQRASKGNTHIIKDVTLSTKDVHAEKRTKDTSIVDIKDQQSPIHENETGKINDEKKHSSKPHKNSHSIFIDSPDEDDYPLQTSNHVDPSLPGTPMGTPMGSDQSNESLNPTNSSSTQMLLHASSHSIISAHAQIATPTNIIYETKITASYENDDEASAGYDNDGSTQAEEND